MKISGFSYIRNGFTYGYPFLQAVQSILPLCHEFVIAVGDSTDGTREAVVGLNSPKIKIVDTVWDENLRQNGKVFAQQANVALDHLTGDWGFHIQADEVIHENDLDNLFRLMRQHWEDERVEGLLLNFLNFYGSYQFVGNTRRWHRKEIRIVRNLPTIRSYRDSQGFRRYPSREGYENGDKGEKLRVKPADATVFHYSYVRPPALMQKKAKYFHSFWHDDEWIRQNVREGEFDYYEIDELARFEGTHPRLMREIIAAQDWEFDVRRIRHRFTVRKKLLHLIEKRTGIRIGEYKNYQLI
ncbi:MAG: hypothetical protein H7Z75_00800 [Ferruginibacter sp.]|nr:hypothetical protein [Cytophagales bacterium]